MVKYALPRKRIFAVSWVRKFKGVAQVVGPNFLARALPSALRIQQFCGAETSF